MSYSSPPRSAPRRSSPVSVRPSQLTGTVLGDRYKIHGYLRRGVGSRVFLAEDLESHGSVVIKMLSPAAANDMERRMRLEQARAKLTPIQHGNLVDLLGVDETDAGIPYLVMEALSGETLDESLRRVGALPLDLALVVARQAAAGLIALHDAGIVHGNVSPENLMLLGAPTELYGVKVLNYGIAAEFRDDQSEQSFDPVRTAYRAPEQLLDERADAESDVYALGVVLLHSLCGKLPFQGADEAECLRAKLETNTLDKVWLDLGQDPRLETIIVNSTRKHPRNRYRSMRALLDALDVIVGLSALDVRALPLTQSPDGYEPGTKRGRERLAAFMATRTP
ncbi:MAG TPA: serine/threonine-protein kinase [Polyangiaceae bacterium]|nr:serine/threonine-protein kinase [Polyangiaceae bacterium]